MPATPIKRFGDDLRLSNDLRKELADAAHLLLRHSGKGEEESICRYAQSCAALLTAVETRLLRQNLDVFAEVSASAGSGLCVSPES